MLNLSYRNPVEIAPERGPRPSANMLKSQVRRLGIAFKLATLWEMVEPGTSQEEVKIMVCWCTSVKCLTLGWGRGA